MEDEATKLKQIQAEADKKMALGSPTSGSHSDLSIDEKKEIDARSIYVGNVEYGTTAEDLEHHFHGCGALNRVTIMCNKYDGHPKGFAYLEFIEKDSIELALALNDSLYRGRQLKVMQKRTNVHGLTSTDRPSRRSSGPRFRPRPRVFQGGFRPMRRPFRERRFYSPY